MKISFFWDVPRYNLIENARSFGVIAVLEAVITSETSIISYESARFVIL
jgi:hypothetical protein